MLRVNLALIRHVQSIRLLQRPLLVRVDVYVALDAFLAHIGPAVTRHPFALALGTLVLAEASFFPLVRRQTFALRPRLRTVLDVVAFLEAQVTEVARRRYLSGLVVQETQLPEMIRKIADTVRQIAPYCAGRTQTVPM